MTREDILDKAKECVCGKRVTDYGKPEDNFMKIARLWNAYLDTPLIDAKDVAIMMALLKIARIKGGNGSDDSFVDLAGYAACAGEIDEMEKKAGNFGSISEAIQNSMSLRRSDI